MSEQQISSGLARKLVERLRFDARLVFDPLRPEQFGQSDAGRNMILNPSGHRLWIREQLRSSGLDKLIPGGIGALPDIYEGSRWLAALAFLTRPRDYVGLIEHLTRYLDWYLDTSRPVPSSRLFVDLLQSRLARVLILPYLIGMYILQMALANSSHTAWILIGYLPIVPLILLALTQNSRDRGADFILHKEELFFYLREAYSDPPEEQPVLLAGEPSSDASSDTLPAAPASSSPAPFHISGMSRGGPAQSRDASC